MKTLQKYWWLFWRFRKQRLMVMMEHRGDFFFWTIVATMWTIFNFFFYSLIVNVRGSIGGWSAPEMYVLISVFTILDAFCWSFFYHNMVNYTEAVFSGDLNQMLLKPVDPQYLISISDNSYTNVLRLFMGLGIFLWAIQRMHASLTIPVILGFVFLICVSLLFIYSIWFIVSTVAFWVERLDNIHEIIPASRQFWQVPRTVFTGVASTFFTVILPFGLVSSIPSEMVLGKNSFAWIAYFTLFACVLFFLSRKFFFYSIKKYSSVGQ